MESSSKLKQRLSRLFRAACKPSTSSVHHTAVDPAFVATVDCGGCRPAAAQVCERQSRGKKERRVRETGGYYETGQWEGSTCPPASPASPSKSSFPAYYYYCIHGDDTKRPELCPSRSKATKKRSTVRLRSNAYGFTSSSSTETDDDGRQGDGFFSSEEREASTTTTFFSSRSLSSDSSEFYASAKKSKKPAAQQRSRRRGSNRREASYWPPGGCKGGCKEGFRPLVASIDDCKKKKKKKEKDEKGGGFAVTKRSKDPYSDFRTSMVEMMMERQMFGAQELERLLHSYLALNSSHLHPLILQAFSDIWLLLFAQ
ncbi:transcription repressor OFP8-like [Zingiber officinale]|nr:transcription repressor OFP8-like [Zingiber officinale]